MAPLDHFRVSGVLHENYPRCQRKYHYIWYIGFSLTTTYCDNGTRFVPYLLQFQLFATFSLTDPDFLKPEKNSI